MNQEIMEEWVRDLRDGTRTQGNSQLRDIDGRQCCLDVLCEQAVRKGIIAPPVYDEYENAYVYGDKNTIYSEWQLLPIAVMNWAGLSKPDPEVLHTEINEMASLSSMNDIMGEDFPFIADCIEKTFKETHDDSSA